MKAPEQMTEVELREALERSFTAIAEAQSRLIKTMDKAGVFKPSQVKAALRWLDDEHGITRVAVERFLGRSLI